MDVAAVSSATHECLTDLGLHAKGDIFALKAFCHHRQFTFTSKNVVYDEKNDYEDRKRELLAQLQTGSQKKRNESVDKHSRSSMSKRPVEKYKTHIDNEDRGLTDEDIKMSTSDNEEIIIESGSENDDEVLMHPVFDSGTTPTGSSEER
ncbi:Hypothetical predicted protein [Paramuricea clavata]|uniref:Uncharacterized protein n=1 Tax=Paramuricea clavata TaxID=317549 RepID=A0A6S7FV38_PARCT|nr:Hypothetical predicted protein [Paramuricea clavata]